MYLPLRSKFNPRPHCILVMWRTFGLMKDNLPLLLQLSLFLIYFLLWHKYVAFNNKQRLFGAVLLFFHMAVNCAFGGLLDKLLSCPFSFSKRKWHHTSFVPTHTHTHIKYPVLPSVFCQRDCFPPAVWPHRSTLPLSGVMWSKSVSFPGNIPLYFDLSITQSELHCGVYAKGQHEKVCGHTYTYCRVNCNCWKITDK